MISDVEEIEHLKDRVRSSETQVKCQSSIHRRKTWVKRRSVESQLWRWRFSKQSSVKNRNRQKEKKREGVFSRRQTFLSKIWPISSIYRLFFLFGDRCV